MSDGFYYSLRHVLKNKLPNFDMCDEFNMLTFDTLDIFFFTNVLLLFFFPETTMKKKFKLVPMLIPK